VPSVLPNDIYFKDISFTEFFRKERLRHLKKSDKVKNSLGDKRALSKEVEPPAKWHARRIESDFGEGPTPIKTVEEGDLPESLRQEFFTSPLMTTPRASCLGDSSSLPTASIDERSSEVRVEKTRKLDIKLLPKKEEPLVEMRNLLTSNRIENQLVEMHRLKQTQGMLADPAALDS